MNTTNTTKTPIEVVDVLRNMKVGDSYEFPAERSNSVRATCSNYGFQWDRQFSTKSLRSERKILVTRTK